MNNLKSYTEYAVTTPTTDFVIGFEFNYGTDAVNITVDDVPATEAGYTVIYLNSTTIRLSPAVPSGVVRLQRETAIDVADNQFTAGAKFNASNMDENFTQIRHAQQEVRDGFSKLVVDQKKTFEDFKADVGYDVLQDTIGVVQGLKEQTENYAQVCADNFDQSQALLSDIVTFATDAEAAADLAEDAATNAVAEVNGLKGYVDSSLAGLSFANKTYATVAAANADIANIAVNQSVWVSSEAEGGLYEKKTAGATSLTKGAYDPLTQAKTYFKSNGTGELIPANSAVINYDTATKVLSFTGTFYVVTNDTTVTSITTPQSFALTSSNPYRIECDPVTNTLFAVSYSAAKTIGRIVLGWIRTPSATLSLEVSGFKVGVNGVAAQRSENGSLITSNPERINFDNTNKKLILHSAVRVKSPTFTMTPNVTVEIPYPSSGTYKLVFNRETNGFLFVLVSTLGTSIDLNRIELATVVFSATAVTSVYGIDNYTIDGSVVSVGGGASLNATLTASVASDINFSFVQNKMTLVSQKVRINYDKVSVLLPAVELNLLDVESRFWQKLIFNKSTQAFSAKQFSTSLTDNELVFALVQPLTKSVVGIADYYVESKPVKYTPREAPHLATYGDLRPFYVQPTLPEFKTALDSFGSDFTKIYDLYDALVAAYPSYVTKSLMGVDGFGNQMFSYQFSTAEVTTIEHGNKKNKFIIFSGIHGGEKGGIYNTYNAMKQICERHADDPNLHALKYGVNFIVVPICSPSSYQIGIRKNGNGVDIARNFPTGWFLASNPESESYGGAAPADQVETQLMLALMEQHKDALCFTSHHNFTSGAQLAWVSARSNAHVNMCKSLIINESVKAKKQFTWIDQSDNYYIGYVSLGAEGNGMEASHAFAMGMYASTVEVGMTVPNEAGSPTYSSAFATLACQFFINYLLCTVDDAVKFHNSQIAYYR